MAYMRQRFDELLDIGDALSAKNVRRLLMLLHTDLLRMNQFDTVKQVHSDRELDSVIWKKVI